MGRHLLKIVLKALAHYSELMKLVPLFSCVEKNKTWVKKAICLITFSDFDGHTSPLFSQLKLLKLQDHIKLQTLYFMHQFFTSKLPKTFDSFFIKTSDKHNVNTRFVTRSTFYVTKIRTMANSIFDTIDLYYGMKLMRDLRFKLLTY